MEQAVDETPPYSKESMETLRARNHTQRISQKREKWTISVAEGSK